MITHMHIHVLVSFSFSVYTQVCMKAIHLCIYTRGHDHAYVFIHVKVISTVTQSFGVKNTGTADDE